MAHLSELSVLDGALDKLQAVTRLEPSLLAESKQKSMTALRDGVKRQRDKLEKNEFHIAVVGLEKAGKSTFLSAWMRAEILPNQDTRCTYTTTEIRSVGSDEEQRIEVDFLKRGDLEALRAQYEEIAATPGREGEVAKEDLNELDKYRVQIEQWLGHGRIIESFYDLSSVMETLRRFVADPATARAVRNVTVYTSSLSDREGIVFHDVPGYDSPITLHKEQAKQELARADIVLFLTNISDTVSLRQSQLEMLEGVSDKEDESIKVKDKTFFFLNKADKTDSAGDLQRRINSALTELVDRYHLCEKDRVIVGSAAAHLIQKPKFITPQTREMLGNVADKLEWLDPPHGDGMDVLRERVEHYLTHDRIDVLSRRCASFMQQGDQLMTEVLSAANERFPGSLEDFDHRRANQESRLAADLFDERWAEFIRRFDAYWQENVLPIEDLEQVGTGTHQSLADLHDRYKDVIDQFDDLLGKDALEAVFRDSRNREARPASSNIRSREQVMEQQFELAVERLTRSISSEVHSISLEVADWVSEWFNKIPDVRTLAVPGANLSDYEKRLEYGFNALIFRFARPAADIFLSTPRGSQDRRNVRESRRTDIYLLDLFYGGDVESPGHLDAFLHSGKWIPLGELRALAEQAGNALEEVAKHHPKAKPTTTILTTGKGILERYGSQGSATSPKGTPARVPSTLGEGISGLLEHVAEAAQAQTYAAVSEEIHEDIEAFLDYLKNSVYFAASFEEVATQELELIRKHIKSDETRKSIRGAFMHALHVGHESVEKELAHNRTGIEHERRVLAALDDLRTRRGEIEGNNTRMSGRG
jgi:hypothetical protein